MDRRDFLQKTLVGAAVAAAAPWNLLARPYPQGEGLGKPGESNPLRLSFQENTAPGETLAERLDYMEAHGVTGFEPGGKNLSARVGELKQALRGQRHLCRVFRIYPLGATRGAGRIRPYDA